MKRGKLILEVILLCVFIGTVKVTDVNQRLWCALPASKWHEALPVGNGSLGGMVFGGIEHEHVQFNEESLITGTTKTIGAYQPFGDVYIDFPALKAENYIRDST